jgi:hypothetical protein
MGNSARFISPSQHLVGENGSEPEVCSDCFPYTMASIDTDLHEFAQSVPPAFISK